VKSAGVAAWRTAVLAAATLLVVVLFVGMGYLVYVDEMSEGPLVLFTGVILGYLLRYVHSVV
jgi:antibiotic biosynthesis monooxygenase (ABM) superfamily enzyme